MIPSLVFVPATPLEIFDVSWKHLTSKLKPKLQLHGNRHASPTQHSSLDNLIVITYLPGTGDVEKYRCKKNELVVTDQCTSYAHSRNIPGVLWPVWN